MPNTTHLYQYFKRSTGICMDSRCIKEGNIFFALKGLNFNGNKFIDSALDKGAVYAVTDEISNGKNDRLLYVPDVLKALQKLACCHRRRLKPTVIALTGSNGKTTTKELINAVLGTTYATQATKGNFNNHIGVPLTLLSLERKTQMAVIEMGANHEGEIAELCNIARPDYGLITGIGKAHLEGFGNIKGVTRAKGELFAYLKKYNGLSFVNMNDKRVAKLGYKLSNVYTYGTNSIYQTNGITLGSGIFLKVLWRFSNQPPIEINTQLTGKYNLDNVLAAIAVGVYFKVPNEHIKTAIENYKPTNNRSQTLQVGGNTIILDAYNANPESMRAALENFESMAAKKKVLILGDMFELGEYSHAEHAAITQQIAGMKINGVLLVGERFKEASTLGGNADYFKDTNELLKKAKIFDFKNTHILIKGSRGMALEKVLDAL